MHPASNFPISDMLQLHFPLSPMAELSQLDSTLQIDSSKHMAFNIRMSEGSKRHYKNIIELFSYVNYITYTTEVKSFLLRTHITIKQNAVINDIQNGIMIPFVVYLKFTGGCKCR